MLHYYHGDFTDKRTIIGIKMAHQCFLHKCSQHLRADPSIFSPLVSLTVVYWWHAPTKVSQQFWVGSSGLYNTSKLCFAWNALWSSSKLNITNHQKSAYRRLTVGLIEAPGHIFVLAPRSCGTDVGDSFFMQFLYVFDWYITFLLKTTIYISLILCVGST